MLKRKNNWSWNNLGMLREKMRLEFRFIMGEG